MMSGAVSGSQDWAGGSPASDSMVPVRRMPSSVSRDPPVSFPSSSFSGTGRASDAKRPSSHAAAARRWLSSAKASMSSRVMPHRSASTWATRNWAHSRPSICSRNDGGNGPVPPRALRPAAPGSSISTPQATTRS